MAGNHTFRDLVGADPNRLNAALDIYRSEIIEEARSPIKQLEYWIENSARKLLTDLNATQSTKMTQSLAICNSNFLPWRTYYFSIFFA